MKDEARLLGADALVLAGEGQAASYVDPYYGTISYQKAKSALAIRFVERESGVLK